MCNLGRGHYCEHLCEIFLNLDQWLWKRCHLKLLIVIFSIFSSGGYFIQLNGASFESEVTRSSYFASPNLRTSQLTLV